MLFRSVHFLSGSTEHITALIDTCRREGIESIEATVEGEDEWLQTLWQRSTAIAQYNRTCTPSYGNSEGAKTMLAARGAVYPGSVIAYLELLSEWRAAGDFAGARTVRSGEG